MTRLFLAAGVAAMAIASAAGAKPGGGGGGGNPHGDGNGAAQATQGGGGHGRGGGGGGGAAPQMQRVERQQVRGPEMRVERQQVRGPEMRVERQQVRGPQMRVARQQSRGPEMRLERQPARAIERQQARGVEHRRAREETRGFARQQERLAQQSNRGQERLADRRPVKDDRVQQVQRQVAANNPVVAERIASFRNAPTSFAANGARGLIDGCPPGLWMKNNGCMPPGQAAKLIGTPLATAAAAYPLSVLPQSLSYFYPDTPDYYYRYGNGYLYQVDRDSQLIASLLPLLGGGYLPGQYLPQPYMASYVPDYYGLNSFYPDYGELCNRYANGVVYEVNCATGYVEDVIPMYASGYGVGQMLPSAYSYYNVPMQYRSLYYDTPDYGYWYAPGAIYQYDQRTNLITSVAALMAPGFTVGQQLPLGYDVYNVPYDYRATYYDTPNAWYRYNNGYIYQVDPMTQIVTAVVASLLT